MELLECCIYLTICFNSGPNRHPNLSPLPTEAVDPSGGWIWKYDNDNTLQHSDQGRWTSSVSGLLYGFEQPSNPPKAAADWLANYWANFEKAAAGPDFKVGQ